MPKTICVPNTSSLKTGSGAIEGVLDEGVLGCSGYLIWAGLMGREDTSKRLSPRVWVGLPYAWMARLVSGYVISFPHKTTLYNPRPLRCVYKPEGLVRRGHQNSHRLDI